MNVVNASCPTHSVTRNRRITCILVKSPLNSCCVISYTRSMICSSDSPIVSPIFLNSHGLRGARIVYQRFNFHLSRCFRAAERAFALTFFAIGINSGCVCIAGATPLASLRLTSPISRTPSDKAQMYDRIDNCSAVRLLFNQEVKHWPMTRHPTLACKRSKIEVAVHHWSQTLTS